MATNENTNVSETTNETKDSTQSRWRSKPLWFSVFSLVGLILMNTGVLDLLGINLDSWNTGINLFLSAVATFGILNNPTDSNSF